MHIMCLTPSMWKVRLEVDEMAKCGWPVRRRRPGCPLPISFTDQWTKWIAEVLSLNTQIVSCYSVVFDSFVEQVSIFYISVLVLQPVVIFYPPSYEWHVLERYVNYRIQRETFEGENFRRLLTCAVPKDATSPNFVEKTFTNSHKTTKFVEVFSLKNVYCYTVCVNPLRTVINTNTTSD